MPISNNMLVRYLRDEWWGVADDRGTEAALMFIRTKEICLATARRGSDNYVGERERGRISHV